MSTDATADYLQHWLDTHTPATDHDRRIIDADLLPGTSRTRDDTDPHGKNADRAAADAWWHMVEPDKGRWAC